MGSLQVNKFVNGWFSNLGNPLKAIVYYLLIDGLTWL